MPFAPLARTPRGNWSRPAGREPCPVPQGLADISVLDEAFPVRSSSSLAKLDPEPDCPDPLRSLSLAPSQWGRRDPHNIPEVVPGGMASEDMPRAWKAPKTTV